MQHVAIMKKSWGFLPKMLSGEKRIESRWYISRYAHWNKIKRSETVYFKNSGEPVTLEARVEKIKQFENLTPRQVKKIINRYGHSDGIALNDKRKFYKLFKHKKYCILIFLSDIKKIRPFNIDKSNFGMMSAWITINKIDKIKIKC